MDLQSILKSVKIHTIDGKGSTAKQIQDEKAEYETQEWMK